MWLNKQTTVIRLMKGFGILLFVTFPPLAFADHGGSQHTNFDLAATPPTGSTGIYTVTWQSNIYVNLQEKVNGGTYSTVYTGLAGTKSFSGKPVGTFTYRIYWHFCAFTCNHYYSEPIDVIVLPESADPVVVFSELNSLVDMYFVEFMDSQDATTQQKADAQTELEAYAQQVSEVSSILYNTDELVVISKIRFLKQYDSRFQGQTPADVSELLTRYHELTNWTERGL